jgi:hypothetical protein
VVGKPPLLALLMLAIRLLPRFLIALIGLAPPDLSVALKPAFCFTPTMDLQTMNYASSSSKLLGGRMWWVQQILCTQGDMTSNAVTECQEATVEAATRLARKHSLTASSQMMLPITDTQQTHSSVLNTAFM